MKYNTGGGGGGSALAHQHAANHAANLDLNINKLQAELSTAVETVVNVRGTSVSPALSEAPSHASHTSSSLAKVRCVSPAASHTSHASHASHDDHDEQQQQQQQGSGNHIEGSVSIGQMSPTKVAEEQARRDMAQRMESVRSAMDVSIAAMDASLDAMGSALDVNEATADIRTSPVGSPAVGGERVVEVVEVEGVVHSSVPVKAVRTLRAREGSPSSSA